MPPRTDDQAIELIKETIKDWNEKGPQLPFVSTLFAAFGLLFLKLEEAKFEDFLNQIRIPLGFGNIAAVSNHIADHMHERWMSEGLGRGWRLGLETMDETARRCAFLMAADYMAQKKVPDRAYRQFGILFMEADESTLRMVKKISAAKTSLAGRYAFVSQSLRHGNVEGERFYEVQDGRENYRLLDGVEDPELLQAACDLLVRAGLMSVWFGHMEMPHARPVEMGVYRVYGEIKHYLANTWKALHQYLEPVAMK